MCDFARGHDHDHGSSPDALPHFGFLVDVPEIRTLIAETRRLTQEISETAARVEALKPAFSRLLAADGWLPEAYASPDTASAMGGGIGQYALYRAEDLDELAKTQATKAVNDAKIMAKLREDYADELGVKQVAGPRVTARKPAEDKAAAAPAAHASRGRAEGA